MVALLIIKVIIPDKFLPLFNVIFEATILDNIDKNFDLPLPHKSRTK